MTTTTHNAPVRPLAAGFTAVTTCRVCGGDELHEVIDLGEQCVGNGFRSPGEATPVAAPLRVVRCGGCSLVQLAHRVDPDLMYASYWYRSGVNRTMRQHLAGLVEEALQLVDFEPDDAVIDIGCNDGTGLACYPSMVTRIGVDPSDIEADACDVRVHDYFSAAAVEAALAGRKARIITSVAMFYDLNEPRVFVDDIARCLHDDGIWVTEMSYLPAMLQAVSYDTICHEHVGYYRIATFEKILEGSGLEVFDVGMNGCNGGSFRLFLAHAGRRRPTQRYLRSRAAESRMLLDSVHPYNAFCKRVAASRHALQTFLRDAQASGRTVYGYGASTKGMVTLQYCGVTPDQVTAIAERNPHKYGLLTPGTGIPICSEAEMRAARPDYLLVLPWHFIDEFLDRESAYLAAGGQLVVPMPEFRIFAHGDH